MYQTNEFIKDPSGTRVTAGFKIINRSTISAPTSTYEKSDRKESLISSSDDEEDVRSHTSDYVPGGILKSSGIFEDEGSYVSSSDF
jgi:hypothetical protein